MASDDPTTGDETDPLVDLRIRVRSSFRRTLRLTAVDRGVPLQTYAGRLLSRGYRSEQRSERRRQRKGAVVPKG